MKEITVDNIEPQSCDITDKGSSCCSHAPAEDKDLKTHWDNTYRNSPEEKLGWYETDLSPTLTLIDRINLPSNARILNVGAGSTTLVDELLDKGYTQVIATDISAVALDFLKARVGDEHVEYIVDDLTSPKLLNDIDWVDLWIDRAVLHFFTAEKEQSSYFDLLKRRVAKGGYVILAEYSLDGAAKCAGLDVHRYSMEMLAEKLGNDFQLVESFEHTYTMPSGDLRPYIYTLFYRS